MLIDTPGFGDTGGREQDELIKNKLNAFFEDFPYKFLNGVVYVSPVSQRRTGEVEEYIFECIKKLFGKDVPKRLVFLFTHNTLADEDAVA